MITVPQPSDARTDPAADDPMGWRDSAGDEARTEWFERALDAVASVCLRLQLGLGATPEMRSVFEAAGPVLRRLGEFDVLAFLETDQDGLEFDIAAIDDPGETEAIRTEVDHHIEHGTFAWSLYENRSIVVRSSRRDRYIVLHVLATPSRVLGMFIGRLGEGKTFLPDAADKALSLVLTSCSNALESGILQRQLSQHNENLSKLVAERTEQLERSEKAAHAASKAKSEFLANMSHEIRTPINGITGMASLLALTPLDEEQHEQVGAIIRSADSLVSIIDDILDYSKVEAGMIELESIRFDLADSVEDVAELLAPRAAEKRVETAVLYDPFATRNIVGDPGRIRQVLTNLVANAVKFTEHGHVLIRVEAGRTADRVRIGVEDTGIGIDPDKLEHIFDKFAQADSSTTRRYGGTGLGLAISRRLARLMGGELWAESRPGAGSTFWLDLPTGHPVGHDRIGTRAGDDRRGPTMIVMSPRTIIRTRVLQVASLVGAHAEAVSTRSELLARLPARPHLAWVVADVGWRPDAMLDLPGQLEAGGLPPECELLALVPPGARDDGVRLKEHGFHHWLGRPVRERRLLSLIEGVPSHPERPPVESGTVGSARILVAEDDPTSRLVAREMLQHLGCEVETVENGHGVLAALKVQDFDLILMDCQMPGMDGYQTTETLRSAGWDRLPIMALTASAMPADRERALASGMNDHLAKPITMESLKAALARWLPAAEAEHGRRAEVASTPSPGDDLPTLDVMDLMARTGGSVEIVDVVTGLFMEDWPMLEAELRRGVDDADFQTLASVAHRLKGSAANIGAKRLARAARDAEARWVAGDGLQANVLLDTIVHRARELGALLRTTHWEDPDR